jgi:hypothetical protein
MVAANKTNSISCLFVCFKKEVEPLLERERPTTYVAGVSRVSRDDVTAKPKHGNEGGEDEDEDEVGRL